MIFTWTHIKRRLIISNIDKYSNMLRDHRRVLRRKKLKENKQVFNFDDMD